MRTDVIFQCLAAATKQLDVMEHLRQEFDAMKLAMEMKYKTDIDRQQIDIEKFRTQIAKQDANTDLLTKQVYQQKKDIEDPKDQNAGLKEHVNNLLIPVTYRDITQGKSESHPGNKITHESFMYSMYLQYLP